MNADTTDSRLMAAKTLILGLLFLVLTGCAGTRYYVLGVPIDKDIEAYRTAEILLGAGVSIAAHIAGHHLAAEIFDVDLEQDGLCERVYIDGHSNAELRWVSRSGFAFQLLVNTGLNLAECTRDTYFTKGFTLTTCLELGTYPLRRRGEGDFHSISDRNGNGELEYGIFSAIAAGNLYLTLRD